jgi:hypothetical protein
MSSKDSSGGPRICIIGAGCVFRSCIVVFKGTEHLRCAIRTGRVGGLIFAINLKRQLGYENYVVRVQQKYTMFL